MKRSILVTIGAAAVVAIAAFAATGQAPMQEESPIQTITPISKVKIIASFYPLYEFSKNVAGEKADVSVFIPIGIEPHDWEPSTGNLLELKESHIFVYNGAGMEPFAEKLVDSGEYSNVLFVETAAGIDLIKTEENQDETHADEKNHNGTTLTEQDDHTSEQVENEHHLQYDPHIWLDPILAKQQVMVIKNALIKIDVNNQQYYEDNANTYSAKFDDLDSKIRAELSNCKKDTIVPFHNAFAYFGNRYGINIHALSGVAPESEATASELKELIDFVKENEIKIIFAEELVDPKLAQVLADEAGAQVLLLSPLEGVSDEEFVKGTSYLDKMEENLMNVKRALECQ